LGWCARAHVYPPIKGKSAFGNRPLIHQFHAVFNAWYAVGDISKVAAPKLFLRPAKWAVVSRNDLEIICGKSSPKLSLMIAWSKRR
jgi:hypothetical protein